ncbi:hypothetical protein D3C72_1530350 [compost metagenome]
MVLKYLPNTTPSEEIISVARFESGFSKSSNEGIDPNKPHEANKKKAKTPNKE